MAQLQSAQPSSESFVLPASFAQQRLWFLDRLESSGGIYNVPAATRLRGPLDVDALELALDALVQRHESLRTVFTLVDGVPHQVISSTRQVALERIDLSHADEPERLALDLAAEHAGADFDLASDELIRATLITLDDEDHVFLLNLHHIITDAWSMGVLNRELAELYGALRAGRPAQLPELPIQYGDYAVWQQEWIQSGGLDQQLEYWKQKLTGAPALLDLPTDWPRPAEQSYRGTTIRTIMPPDLLAKVRELGERQGTTLFMTLMAAFVAMLSRYSGQTDVVVATPVANRSRVELESIIGLFVNTLALRVDVDDDPSFIGLLRRVRETALEAFSNQDLPFEKLVAELNPERSQSYAPVAQVLFVLQNGLEQGATWTGLERERLLTERGTAKFDLALFAGEVPEGLRVAIEFCSDLFEPATIEWMLKHYQVLLEAAVADPSTPVSRLAMLSEAERDLVLEGFNDSAFTSTQGCVHEWFDSQARLTPDAIAIESGRQRVTYGELQTRANQLAHHLVGLGVGPDVVVAMAVERSIEMIVGVVAVLKAGGAYAPIDPVYPSDRLAFMLEDSGASVLLTLAHLRSRFPPHDVRTVCLDADEDEIADADGTVPEIEVNPDNLAYVIYTSGSTGWPKGVAMPHRPLANLIAWQRRSPGSPVAARTLQFASLSFDVAFQEIFSTLCSGGTLVLIDDDTRRDAHALVRMVAGAEVQRLFLPYVALRSMCEAAEHLQVSFTQLREVITAGEQLKATPPIRRFFNRQSGSRLFNHYGPSETHVVTSYQCDDRPDRWPTLPPIGRPISNARTYLLDRHLQPVPVGVPGELYIGGAGIARGYLNRPELTAQRFSDDPFAPSAGARMYRTGDRARHRPNGDISFLGRADDQVKIRGFRVELGEVEATLSRHPSVAEAVVVLAEDRPGDSRLVAYVVPRDGAHVGETDLLSHVRGLIPDYMVPQCVIQLDDVPLTPSGKLDRRALPAPPGRDAARRGFAAPGTELEQALASIWQQLLGVGQISIDDDFFDLGGHSLLAIQLVHAVEQKIGRTSTLPMLFRNRTIRALANELHAGGVDATEPSILKLANGTGPALFCICGVHAYQELAEELAPDYSVYGIFLPVEQNLLNGANAGRTLKRPSVEEMAALYVAAVREQQPSGPYLLLGFCFGGVLAYEAAQQLRLAGEEVSLLAMLDTTLGSVMGRRGDRALVPRLRRSAVQHYELLPKPIQRRLVGVDWQSQTRQLEFARSRIYSRAMRRYRVAAYGGAVVLVRPETSARAYAADQIDETWGWGRHISDLEVRNVPGAHLTHLKRPQVQALARSLRPLLDRAQLSRARAS
jgi:amino acid adenylation domain-containing protein